MADVSTFTVGRLVRADNALEAAAVAYLQLPADHRAAAELVSCERERWLPAGVSPIRPELGLPASFWNVTFLLPSFSVAELLVPDHPPKDAA